MSDLPNVLDFDQVVEVPVKLGGREFKLTQQSWPTIKRIIKFVNTDAGTPEKEEQDLTDLMASKFEASLPVIALMFGFEQDDTTKQEVVDFLQLHMTPRQALAVFQTWWKLNEVDDFFDRGGRILTHPEIVELIKRAKAEAVAESVN